MNLMSQDVEEEPLAEEPPKISFAREKLLEEARRVLDAGNGNQKRAVSLVVIGP